MTLMEHEYINTLFREIGELDKVMKLLDEATTPQEINKCSERVQLIRWQITVAAIRLLDELDSDS